MRSDSAVPIFGRASVLSVTVVLAVGLAFTLCACEELGAGASSTSATGTTIIGATVTQPSLSGIVEEDTATSGGSGESDWEPEDETPTETLTAISLYPTMSALTTTTRVSQTFVVGVEEDGLSTGILLGDRIRVVHHLNAADGVRYVAFPVSNWNLRLIDNDVDKNAAGAVVQAWVELEAVTAGTVTIEAWYEYFSGRYVKEWEFYLNILE